MILTGISMTTVQTAWEGEIATGLI